MNNLMGYDDYNGEDVGADMVAINSPEQDDIILELPKWSEAGYLITCRSPYTGNLLYYQDRSKQKKRFWSESTRGAFRFRSKTAAEQYWKRLRYNHPQIWLITPGTKVAVLIKE